MCSLKTLLIDLTNDCAFLCSVVILVDLSISNVNYLVHIQHSLRLLLEQQMTNKDYFNIIT